MLDDGYINVVSASKDYNARGRCRHHWFRMVWDNTSWQYFGPRLGGVGIRASERRGEVVGEVPIGAYVVQHDRGGPVDRMYVVTEGGLELVEFRRRAGKIVIERGGELLEFPDPRR